MAKELNLQRASTGVDSSKFAHKLSWLVALILVFIPFHAFLTVWLSSALHHYILLRLWKELLLVILVLGGLYLLVDDARLRKKFFTSRLMQLIVIYFLVTLLWGAVAYDLHKVTPKALGYGLVVNLRFLFFFAAVWLIGAKSDLLKRIWPKLLLIPAAIVIFVGLLQRLILPYDVLKHFGYGANTIYPYETINHNVHYPRIMSTLRGANPLGAYLVLILSSLVAGLMKFKKQRWLLGILGLAGLLALLFSYSRGAWAGLALSFLVLAWLSLKNVKTRRLLAAALTVILIIGIASALALRNNPTFENYLFHTQKNSQVAVSSNQSHVSAFRSGLHDASHNPLGRGTGTAGPASIYNDGQPRVAENYYIQIAQEVGWLGLALFLAINFLVARELWYRRGDTLAVALLASFIGIVFINLVSHAWTDDTLSYLWWGLAGLALAPILDSKRKQNGREKLKP